MTITPTGILADPLIAMRDQIAASAAFQSWCGVADATAALARIHLLIVPPGAPRPFVMLDIGDYGRERVAAMNGARWAQTNGTTILAWIQAEADSSGEVDLDADGMAVEPDATYAFLNHAGSVWTELEASAGVQVDRRPATIRIEIAVPIARVEVEQRSNQGDYFETAWRLTMSRQP